MKRFHQQRTSTMLGKVGFGFASPFSSSWEQTEEGRMNQNPGIGMGRAMRRARINYAGMDSFGDGNDGGEWERTQENRRKKYMGRTPSKSTPTGRTVIKRTYDENPGSFEFGGENELIYREYMESGACPHAPLPEGFLKNVLYNDRPLEEYDMGHRIDAVTKWNDFFSNMGEVEGKKLAQIWMQKPEIYELQVGSENRSAGGILGHTPGGQYQEPETNPIRIQQFMEEHEDEINEIRGML